MATNNDFSHLDLDKLAQEFITAIVRHGTDDMAIRRIARLAQRYGSEFVNALDANPIIQNAPQGSPPSGPSMRERLIDDHDYGEDEILAAFGFATEDLVGDSPSESDAKARGELNKSNFKRYGVGGTATRVKTGNPDYTYDKNNPGHREESTAYFKPSADKRTEDNPEGVDWGQAHPRWPKDADGKPLPKDANGNPVMPEGDQQKTPDPKLDSDGNPIPSKPEAPAEQEEKPAEDETVNPEDAAPKGPPAASIPDPRQEEIKGTGRGLQKKPTRKPRMGNPGSSIPDQAGARDRAAIENWQGKKLKRAIRQDEDMDRKNDIIRDWVDSIKGPGAYDAATPEEKANAAANYIAKSKASPTHPDNNPDFVPKASASEQAEADRIAGGPSKRADDEVRRILDERKARGEDVASTDTYEGNRPKATASMDNPGGEVVAEGSMMSANVGSPPQLESGQVPMQAPGPNGLPTMNGKTVPFNPITGEGIAYPTQPQPRTQVPPADSDPTAGLPPLPPKPSQPRTLVPPADSDPTAGLPPVPPKPTSLDDPSVPDYSDKVVNASPIDDPNTPDYSDKITDVPDYSDKIVDVPSPIDDPSVPDYSDKIVDAPHPTLDDPSVPDYSDKIVDVPSPIDDPNVPDYSDKIVDVPSPIDDPNAPDYSDKIVDVPKPGDKAREYLANLEKGIDKRPDGAAPSTPAPAPVPAPAPAPVPAPAPAPVVSMEKPAQDPSRSHSTPEGRERPITQTELLFNSIRDHYARMGEDISNPNSPGMEKARRDFTLMQNQWKNMHPAEKDNFINSKIMSHNEHRPNPLTGNQQDIDDYKNKRDMDNMDWRGRMQSVGLGQEDMVRRGVNQDILDRTGGRGPSFHANPKYGNAKAAGDAYQDWRGGLTPSQTKQHDDFLFPEGRPSPAAIMETKRRDIINDDMVNRVPKFETGGLRAESAINDFNKKSRYEQSKRLGMNHLTNSFL